MKNVLFVSTGVILGLMAALGMAMAGESSVFPEAEAQAGPSAGTGAGDGVIMGTGGVMPNMNDIAWILVPDGKSGHTLCLYRAISTGRGAYFDLVDVRNVTYDSKLIQLKNAGHDPKLAPSVIKRLIDEQQKKDAKAAAPRKRGRSSR